MHLRVSKNFLDYITYQRKANYTLKQPISPRFRGAEDRTEKEFYDIDVLNKKVKVYTLDKKIINGMDKMMQKVYQEKIYVPTLWNKEYTDPTIEEKHYNDLQRKMRQHFILKKPPKLEENQATLHAQILKKLVRDRSELARFDKKLELVRSLTPCLRTELIKQNIQLFRTLNNKTKYNNAQNSSSRNLAASTLNTEQNEASATLNLGNTVTPKKILNTEPDSVHIYRTHKVISKLSQTQNQAEVVPQESIFDTIHSENKPNLTTIDVEARTPQTQHLSALSAGQNKSAKEIRPSWKRNRPKPLSTIQPMPRITSHLTIGERL